MTTDNNKNAIVIPRKAMLGIVPAITIIAILLAKDKAPEAFLFGIGITIGVFIGKGFFLKPDENKNSQEP